MLYFEFETVLKLYDIETRLQQSYVKQTKKLLCKEKADFGKDLSRLGSNITSCIQIDKPYVFFFYIFGNFM